VKGRRSPEDSLEHLEAARRLQPGDPDLLADLATTLPFAGRAEEAVQTIRRAMELNPTHPNWYFAASGVAFLFTNQPEQAVRDLQKWSKAYPDWHIPYVFLASAHGVAGQEEQARASIQKHDDLVGPFSLYALNRTWPMADPEKEIFNRGLMVAGVK
jgi:adenylate cyclase